MNPLVRGPVTGGSHGWPFGAAAFDLEQFGYVEEEYFVTGTAARYGHAPGTGRSFDGRWLATRTDSAPFSVRILVRRPRERTAFNGTVVLMWNNVSLGYEIFTGETDALYRRGFAFVGAGVQHIGVHSYPEGEPRGLVAWDPARYGDLSVPDDGLSFDIYTQIARVVGRARSGTLDPVGGLPVERVLGFGVSQSATYLATYLNAIQSIERALDGFLLDVYFGNGAILNPGDRPRALARPELIAAAVPLMPPGSHLLRDDLGVPVFVLNSETEAALHYPVRQPDSASYRFWEVAGVAHGSDRVSDVIPTTWTRDLGLSGHPLAPEGPNNVLTLDGVRAAALVAMQRWMVDGMPPPSMPRIEFAGDPPVIVRDEYGIARGGIRLPEIAVPRATHKGVAIDGSLALFGSSVPFSEEQLRMLYPDEETYQRRWTRAKRAAIETGLLLS